jgi:hypothetical protein
MSLINWQSKDCNNPAVLESTCEAPERLCYLCYLCSLLLNSNALQT